MDKKVGTRKYKGQDVTKYELFNPKEIAYDAVPYRLGTKHEYVDFFKRRYGKLLYNELFSKNNEFCQ